jgi:hypothetical protein
MSENWFKFISALPAIITAAVALAGLLGLAKYLIEPWYNARALRRKYATALWIACADLKISLNRIHEQSLQVTNRRSKRSRKSPTTIRRRMVPFDQTGSRRTATTPRVQHTKLRRFLRGCVSTNGSCSFCRTRPAKISYRSSTRARTGLTPRLARIRVYGMTTSTRSEMR